MNFGSNLNRARLKQGAALVAIGVAISATPVLAQSTDEIIVTGSRITNPNLERSTPVNATTSEEIELKQSNNAESILRELPGVVPSIGSAVNNGNGGASFVNLRGLGSNRNIVLLDGVRLVPAELNGRFDLNNVPLALIERVDVLTGGASTTYGADAISGVVNFITKSDFSGLEATVSEQMTEQGDGEAFRADVTIGANLDDGRGNVVLAVGYQSVDPVYQGDRAFSSVQYDSFTGAGGGSGTTAPSRFSIPGTGTRQIDPATGNFKPTAAFNAFNFNPYNVFQTPFERYNVYAAARYEITDGIEAYTRGIFSKNVVSTIIAPSGAFGLTVAIPYSNPFLPAGARATMCAANGLTNDQCAAAALATSPTDPNYRTFSTTMSRRAVESGPRISDYTTTFFDYKFGLRGDLTDSISWDVFGSYGQSENNQVQQGYWLNSRVKQALLATNTNTCLTDTNGCVPLNPFGAAGSITEAMNNFLSANSQVQTKFSLAQVAGNVNGETGFVLPWAGDEVSFAVGGEYRKYTGSQESDLLSQSGDLGGAGGAAPNISGGFEVYEALAEVIVPLVQDKPLIQDLTLETGIRYSSYKVDAPSSPSYKTTTWKAGGSWTPVDGLKVRGNYARAVRAPNIAELFSPINTGLTNLATDPCASLDDNGNVIAPAPTGVLRDTCIAQGAPASVIGQISVPTAGQANSTGGGNIDLKPETSNSWSLGFVWEPESIPGFNMTVDYYNIKVDGAITTPTPGDALAACFDDPSPTKTACTIIRRSTTTGSLSGDSSEVPGLFLGLSNLGKLATDGVDLTMNYSRDVGFAKLALSFVGNWTNKSTFQATPSDINRDCVGYYSVNCGSIQPKFQWSQRTTLSFEKFDVSLLWRHLDAVQQEPLDAAIDPAFSGEIPGFGAQNFGKIAAYDYFDLSGKIDVLENLTLTLTVQNLFDKQPPITGNTIGSTSYNSGNTYPSTYDALGRRYAVSAKVKF